jgi:hypothetical protein
VSELAVGRCTMASRNGRPAKAISRREVLRNSKFTLHQFFSFGFFLIADWLGGLRHARPMRYPVAAPPVRSAIRTLSTREPRQLWTELRGSLTRPLICACLVCACLHLATISVCVCAFRSIICQVRMSHRECANVPHQSLAHLRLS